MLIGNRKNCYYTEQDEYHRKTNVSSVTASTTSTTSTSTTTSDPNQDDATKDYDSNSPVLAVFGEKGIKSLLRYSSLMGGSTSNHSYHAEQEEQQQDDAMDSSIAEEFGGTNTNDGDEHC